MHHWGERGGGRIRIRGICELSLRDSGCRKVGRVMKRSCKRDKRLAEIAKHQITARKR